jgi:cytochrome c553
MKLSLQRLLLGCTLISAPWMLGPDWANAQAASAPPAVYFCAPCHGLDGIGHDIEIPNLAGQHDVYMRNQLMAFRTGRRQHPEMRYMARKLNDKDIDALVIYYSKLRPY